MIDATLSHPIKQTGKFFQQRFYVIFKTNAEDIVDFWGNPRHQKYQISKVAIMPGERRYITPFTDITKPVVPFIPDEIKSELVDFLKNEWNYHGKIDYKEPQMN